MLVNGHCFTWKAGSCFQALASRFWVGEVKPSSLLNWINGCILKKVASLPGSVWKGRTILVWGVLVLTAEVLSAGQEGGKEKGKVNQVLLTHACCLWKSSLKWRGSCWKRHNPSAYICTCYEENTVDDVNGKLSVLSCCRSYSSHTQNRKLFRYVL